MFRRTICWFRGHVYPAGGPGYISKSNPYKYFVPYCQRCQKLMKETARVIN